MSSKALIFCCVFALLCIVQLCSALSCNEGTDSTVIQAQVTSDLVCMRFRFKCTTGDALCTDAEISAGKIKTRYTATSQANCDVMKATPSVYMNAMCCSTDNCNVQVPTSDATKVGLSFVFVLILIIATLF